MDYTHSYADISSCGKYRYSLRRRWEAPSDLGTCLFIMLNPSTADSAEDDPTIRRCVGFAQSFGCTNLSVVNLFAYRATDPRELLPLLKSDDPIGPRNQRVIEREAEDAKLIIAAWGTKGNLIKQDQTVLAWLRGRTIHALKLTKDGMPCHPLYLPKDLKPILFTSTHAHGRAE